MSHRLKTSDFGKLSFMNGELKDINIIVKTLTQEWKFSAHKLVLSCASPYFQKILRNTDLQEITLYNTTPSTTYMLLRYMYCGELHPESWNDVNELMLIAHKYEMNELTSKCGKFLENVLTLQNVCYIYEKATICSLCHLQQKCLKLILDSGFLILKSHAFQLLDKNCITDVISSIDLNIDTEYTVFEALFRWARLECVRKNLKITVTNITALIEPFLGLMSIDDMSDAEKSALPPSILTRVKPNNRTRVGFIVPESLLVHSTSLEFETDYDCLEFLGVSFTCIRFSVTHPTYLIGLQFKCVGIPSYILHLKVMKENAPNAVLAENLTSTIMSCTETNNKVWLDLKILLNHPVYLTPTVVYNIYINDQEIKTQAPQTKLINSELNTPSGHLNLVMHSSDVWGITKLLFI